MSCADPAESSAPTSLLAHCLACQSKCCRNDHIVATEKEHDRFLESGAEDHFAKVILPQGNFYVLDFKLGDCRYLGEDNRCSIEEYKPIICRSYPVRADRDVDVSCPAADVVTNAFKENAKKVISARSKEIDPNVYWAIMDAYNRRHLPGLLDTMQAVVIAAPTLNGNG